jgi:hypothetical protein
MAPKLAHDSLGSFVLCKLRVDARHGGLSRAFCTLRLLASHPMPMSSRQSQGSKGALGWYRKILGTIQGKKSGKKWQKSKSTLSPAPASRRKLNTPFLKVPLV